MNGVGVVVGNRRGKVGGEKSGVERRERGNARVRGREKFFACLVGTFSFFFLPISLSLRITLLFLSFPLFSCLPTTFVPPCSLPTSPHRSIHPPSSRRLKLTVVPILLIAYASPAPFHLPPLHCSLAFLIASLRCFPIPSLPLFSLFTLHHPYLLFSPFFPTLPLVPPSPHQPFYTIKISFFFSFPLHSCASNPAHFLFSPRRLPVALNPTSTRAFACASPTSLSQQRKPRAPCRMGGGGHVPHCVCGRRVPTISAVDAYPNSSGSDAHATTSAVKVRPTTPAADAVLFTQGTATRQTTVALDYASASRTPELTLLYPSSPEVYCAYHTTPTPAPVLNTPVAQCARIAYQPTSDPGPDSLTTRHASPPLRARTCVLHVLPPANAKARAVGVLLSGHHWIALLSYSRSLTLLSLCHSDC